MICVALVLDEAAAPSAGLTSLTLHTSTVEVAGWALAWMAGRHKKRLMLRRCMACLITTTGHRIINTFVTNWECLQHSALPLDT